LSQICKKSVELTKPDEAGRVMTFAFGLDLPLRAVLEFFVPRHLNRFEFSFV